MGRRTALPLTLLAVLLALSPLAANAQTDAPPPAVEESTPAAEADAGTSDTALGALAAIGCGFMVRATIATGFTQVGTIAGAVASCGYMLIDALLIDRK
jgi:hypothetical protein